MKNILKNKKFNRKLFFEILVILFFVLGGTWLIYNQLSEADYFWNEQFLWNIAMMICWTVVSFGYFHQGWLVRSKKHPESVSIVLPIAVFFVQCILFIKGIYYNDWALIGGALLVNSGVVFDLFQIIKERKFPD